MSSYIKEMGSQLVRDQEQQKDPVNFVQGLLNLRDKYEAIVTQSFRNDRSFQKTLKEVNFIQNSDDHRAESTRSETGPGI